MKTNNTTTCYLKQTHHAEDNPKYRAWLVDCPLVINKICKVCCHHIKNEGGDKYLVKMGFENPTWDFLLESTRLSEEEVHQTCRNCPNYKK